MKLTDEQKKQVQELQKEVDGQLDRLLTAEQKKKLDDMKKGFARGPGPGGPPFGPGGFGPPGGPGGFGPPGGPGGFGPPGGNSVFRAYRYAPNYPGLAGKDLTPGSTMEELQAKQSRGK